MTRMAKRYCVKKHVTWTNKIAMFIKKIMRKNLINYKK